ncbi:MAG TPA: glycosyltransferase [Terriglobales bacterium]|nr:glycosyltransferase [Terriglobales bacterium]
MASNSLQQGFASATHAPILYITLNGVLEPLGQSQVLPYIFALSRRGFPYALLSMERQRDLADEGAVERLERELGAHGITWAHLPYHTGGIGPVLQNCWALFWAGRRLIRSERIRLVHARSYVATSVAWALRLVTGVPYVFDMRGYWIDESVAEGRWFVRPFVYRVAKRLERRLVADAAAVTTLTGLQADDVRTGKLGNRAGKAAVTIPTCADYGMFAPRELSVVPPEVRARLEGKLVIGLVGSINASYRVEDCLRLFQAVLERRPEAHLLCLTQQPEAMAQLLSHFSLTQNSYTVRTVAHAEMPGWLSAMDWGLLLMNEGIAKRGSMPTKLAEFFAAGVRPVMAGCNPEARDWVRRAGSGIVLEDVTDAALQEAAARIASAVNADELARAREATRPHFSLESGVARYEALLQDLA